MIKGVHALFYSNEPDAMRTFMRDKLKLPFTDVGEGWLIFDVAEGDIGIHPTEGEPPTGTHDVSFYCDDIEETVAELSANGVAFEGEVQDHGYGLVTYFSMPGNVRVQLYQPRYEKRTALRKAASSSSKKKKPAAKKKAAPVKSKARPAKKTTRKKAGKRR